MPTRPRKEAGEVEITIQQATKIARSSTAGRWTHNVRQADDGAVIVSVPSYAGDTKPLLIDKKATTGSSRFETASGFLRSIIGPKNPS